jgi:predicted hotdog family 3-hydroxylacyl-ACP dehydratase
VLVDREHITALIPHQGAMSLLDGVVRWDTASLQCVSRSHRDAENPLRSHGQLPALCAIEYAAQAMAVHGGLSGMLSARPAAGYLASLRDVNCRVDRIDDLEGELVVDVEKLAASDMTVSYGFSVRVGAVQVIEGRAAVLLEAP